MYRKFITYLLSSLVIIAITWQLIGHSHNIHIHEIFSQLKLIFAKPGSGRGLVFFVALFALSMLARGFRYKLLARSIGERISLGTSLKAIFIGRAYTLITPTALFGGQPISYYVLNLSGVKWKTSGMLLIMTTMLDFLFFLLASPLLCFMIGKSNFLGCYYFLPFFIATTIASWFLFVTISPCLFGHCGWIIRLYGSICRRIPFCKRFDLESALKGWVDSSHQSICAINKSFLSILGIVVLTILAFIPHYLGVFAVLHGVGVNIDMHECLLRTVLVNFTTLLFSPGAGSVTGDIGFIALFSQYLSQDCLLGMDMVFNGLCYWIPIAIGLVFSVFFLLRSSQSVVQFHFSDNFLAINNSIAKLVLKSDGSVQECPVATEKDYMFIVENNSDNELSALIDGKLETLYRFKATQDCQTIEFGKRDFPDYDDGFSWKTILKASLSRRLVRMLFPYFHHRLKQRKPLLPRWMGNMLKISEKTYGKTLADSLHALLKVWDTWDGPRRRLVRAAVSGYVESSILRADLRDREKWWMPALLSLQVTNDCNLHCRGCQVSCVKRPNVESRYRSLMNFLREFHSYGGRHVLLLGGEPLMLGERLIDLTSAFPDMTFVLFTNATLFTETIARKIAKRNNVVTLLSVDGTPEETTYRRGPHVFEKVLEAQSVLNKHHLLNGISVMLHRDNAQLLRDLGFLKSGFGLAHQFVMFVTYTNTYGHTDVQALDLPSQMAFYRDVCEERQRGYPFYFLPQDEMFVHGGCGGMRGIFHINEDGNLVKCPFSFDKVEYRNLAESGFKKAFQNSSCGQCSTCTANFVTMLSLLESEEVMKRARAAKAEKLPAGDSSTHGS